jgi:hypothetical protein
MPINEPGDNVRFSNIEEMLGDHHEVLTNLTDGMRALGKANEANLKLFFWLGIIVACQYVAIVTLLIKVFG